MSERDIDFDLLHKNFDKWMRIMPQTWLAINNGQLKDVANTKSELIKRGYSQDSSLLIQIVEPTFFTGLTSFPNQSSGSSSKE